MTLRLFSFKIFSTCIIVLGLSTTLMAQEKDLIDTALIPFWKTSTMYNESVMMISRNGQAPVAKLLFAPSEILSVRNAALNISYKEGVDWSYEAGQLKLLKSSTAAFMTDKQLYPDTSTDAFPRRGGGLIYFREGSFFHNQQLAVSYTHAPDEWKGPMPTFQGKHLPNAMNKLRRRVPLKLLLFGDSIAAGANASGENNTAPGLPSWGNLVAEALRRYFKGEIDFTNTAEGGKDSKWGLATIQENVIAHQPDLVILAFGMNDGTLQMDPISFTLNIQGMINSAKLKNPDVEFILVTTMLPNPESDFVGTHLLLNKALQELKGQGIVLVDMGSVHAELLRQKSYQDMTGNNINHPNDFLIRWYAQQILGALIPGDNKKN